MSYAQPQTKTSQILEQVSEVYSQKNQHEVSLYRLRRQAESKVKLSGKSTDYVVLGDIQTRLNYPNQVRDTFNHALRLFPYELDLYVNYSVSLSHLGFMSEAITFAQKAYEMQSDNSFIINHLIDCYIGDGQFKVAQTWCDIWQQNQQQAHHYSPVLEQAVEILRHATVSMNAVTQLFQMAYSVLHDNGIYYMPTKNLSIQRDDESIWIAFRIDILRPVDEVVDFIVELAERFAETELGKQLDNKLVIGYQSGLE